MDGSPFLPNLTMSVLNVVFLKVREFLRAVWLCRAEGGGAEEELWPISHHQDQAGQPLQPTAQAGPGAERQRSGNWRRKKKERPSEPKLPTECQHQSVSRAGECLQSTAAHRISNNQTVHSFNRAESEQDQVSQQ